MTKVESGIPIPTTRKTKYPWLQMEIGDSFTVNASYNNNAGKIRSAAAGAGRRYKRRFTIRTIDDGQTIRVWRTA